MFRATEATTTLLQPLQWWPQEKMKWDRNSIEIKGTRRLMRNNEQEQEPKKELDQNREQEQGQNTDIGGL